MLPVCLGEAAFTMVGTPFRLHGTDPATGLDCVGLVYASLVAMGRRAIVPRGYGLRNVAIGQWLALAKESGLEPASGPIAADEVLLVTLGYGQHHLMITRTPHEVIHAHAGLRRVVRHRLAAESAISARWRIASSKER